MRNVWEERKHNLSGSVLVTLVLIAQLAVFFWQGTLIDSYFAAGGLKVWCGFRNS